MKLPILSEEVSTPSFIKSPDELEVLGDRVLLRALRSSVTESGIKLLESTENTPEYTRFIIAGLGDGPLIREYGLQVGDEILIDPIQTRNMGVHLKVDNKEHFILPVVFIICKKKSLSKLN